MLENISSPHRQKTKIEINIFNLLHMVFLLTILHYFKRINKYQISSFYLKKFYCSKMSLKF